MLVEVLLPLVVELDFLIHTESNGIGYSLLVLLLASFDLDIDVSRYLGEIFFLLFFKYLFAKKCIGKKF